MLKRTVLTIALTCALLNALSHPALAQSRSCPHEQNAASCAEGYTWDKETGTCVEQVLG